MATHFAETNSLKIIDIFDDFFQIPIGPKYDDLNSRIQIFIDDLILELGSANLPATEVYSKRVADIKQKAIDKLTLALNEGLKE